MALTQLCFVPDGTEVQRIGKDHLWGLAICDGVSYVDAKPPLSDDWHDWPRHRACVAILAKGVPAHRPATTANQP